jgi:hypothetical protein
MLRQIKLIKSRDPVRGSKRTIRIENAWLLYNYDTLKDWFWTRKQAMQEAQYQSGEEKMPEYYQILRGTLTVELHD